MSTPSSIRRFVRTVVNTSPRLTVVTVALTFCAGLVEGIGLLVLVPLLQLVGLDAQQGALGRMLLLFKQAFAAVGLAPTLPAVLGLYVAIVVAQSLIQRLQASLQADLREQVVHTLRTRLYRAIAGTTWVYFSRHRAAAFGQLLTDRVDRVANAAYYLLDLFVTAVLALVYVAIAFRVSPAMTLFVLLAGAALALVLRGRLTRARRIGHEYAAASTRLHGATFEHLGSMKMAKGYGAEQRHADHFAQLSAELSEATRRTAQASVSARQWTAVGSAVMLALIVYVAQAIVRMSPASMLLLIFLFARLVPRVTAIYEKAQVLALELPSFEAVLDAEASCLAAAEPTPAVLEPMPFTRAIQCRHVTFAYAGDGTAALRDITLSIPAHTTTAIVGPSGAGKSTLADLLMGLVAPSTGVASVDDQPLTAERLHAWRSQVGYVAQDTFLFHDTVRANLLWARPEASDADIWHALDQAAAADFVRAMPDGLDTTVGDRGLLLSGGERQRLSLARALLRRPQVLILDEATSALDSENEQRIQAAIERLHEQMTIVVITHRLSTIRNADVIHVLDGGRIVESGTWTTLAARSAGRFRALCAAQGVDVVAPVPFVRAHDLQGSAAAGA